MLPHVDHEQRDGGDGDVALLVGELQGDQALADGVPREDRPARALQAQGRGRELRLELLEGAEELVDGGGELALGARSALAGHVRPEDRVVHVAAEVEGQVLLEEVDGGEIAGLAGGLELLEGGVGARHVVRVVLVVVQLHDGARDVGLQGGVVVGQVGQGVNGHGAPYALSLAPA